MDKGDRKMAGSVKNGSVKIGNTQMYYVAFGKGEKNLVENEHRHS